MIPNKMTFTLKEIAAAAGQDYPKLYSRFSAMRKKGEINSDLHALTYEDAKAILNSKPRPRDLDPKKVDALKRQLIDDGMAHK